MAEHKASARQVTIGLPAKRKWFQVIRFPALLTTGMHGTEHCNRKRRALRLSAPRWPLSPAAGSTLSSAPQLSSDRGRIARNGLSLACNGSRSHGLPFQGQRSWPATSLPILNVPLPVRPFGSATDSGSPRSRPLQRFRPVAASATRLDLPLPRPPLPFGTFTSLRIKAFYRIRCQPTRLPNSARSPFAPRCRLYY